MWSGVVKPSERVTLIGGLERVLPNCTSVKSVLDPFTGSENMKVNVPASRSNSGKATSRGGVTSERRVVT